MGVFLRSFIKQLPQFINMVEFTGNFVRTKEEKYEDFLTKLGVGYLMRKAATVSTPTMEITESGGKWKMETKTVAKSIVLEFELGKELMKQPLMVANAKPL